MKTTVNVELVGSEGDKKRSKLKAVEMVASERDKKRSVSCVLVLEIWTIKGFCNAKCSDRDFCQRSRCVASLPRQSLCGAGSARRDRLPTGAHFPKSNAQAPRIENASFLKRETATATFGKKHSVNVPARKAAYCKLRRYCTCGVYV